jgi:hypothetical protein
MSAIRDDRTSSVVNFDVLAPASAHHPAGGGTGRVVVPGSARTPIREVGQPIEYGVADVAQ